MDTLVNLKAFLSVARTGSFAAAARELNIAPTVVTKRISQIEWRLKRVLFERSTRRVSLTSTGLRYLPAVRQAVADMDGLFLGFDPCQSGAARPDKNQGAQRASGEAGRPCAGAISAALPARQH